MKYVYMRTEPMLWTAGHYRPDGSWEPESDHGSADEAAARVAWLNGSTSSDPADLAQWIVDDAAGEDEAVREFAASIAARIRTASPTRT